MNFTKVNYWPVSHSIPACTWAGCVSQHALGQGCATGVCVTRGVRLCDGGVTGLCSTHSPDQRKTLTEAGGTYLTGMHSCLYFFYIGLRNSAVNLLFHPIPDALLRFSGLVDVRRVQEVPAKFLEPVEDGVTLLLIRRSALENLQSNYPTLCSFYPEFSHVFFWTLNQRFLLTNVTGPNTLYLPLANEMAKRLCFQSCLSIILFRGSL